MKRPLLFLLGVWILGECAAMSAGVSLHPPTLLDTRMQGGETAQVRVFGVVEEVRPTSSGYAYVLGEAEAELEGERLPTRKVLVYAEAEEAPGIGVRLVAEGELTVFETARNPGGFDYRAYYQAMDIDYRLTEEHRKVTGGRENRFLQFLTDWRAALGAALETLLGEEESGELEAMLLGDRSGVSADLRRAYREASLSHLLSVSGLHISLLAVGLERLLKKAGMPPLLRLPLCGTAALSYVWMCGGTPGAVRAGIMFLLYLCAQAAGRTYDMLSALGAAGLLLLAEHPLLLFQSSFRLSALAVLGMAAVWPELRKWSGIPDAPGFSLAIGWVTWPVLASVNGMVPLLGILVNLLALPLAGLLLVSGGLSAFFTVLSLPGSDCLILPARGILRWYRFLAESAASVPGHALITGCPEPWQAAVYYILLAVFLRWMKDQNRREEEQKGKKKTDQDNKGQKKSKREKAEPREKAKKIRLRRVFWVLALSAVFLCLLHRPPVQGLEVCFLDVGQGDSILIRDRNSAVLIDGGSSSVKETGEEVILPALRCLGISRLDAVIATHADADHVNGLPALFEDVSLETGRLVLSEAEMEDPGLGSLREAAQAKGSRILVLSAGEMWQWEKALLRCLYPTEQETERFEKTDTNNTSLVLQLETEAGSFLFTGDLGEEGEASLLAREAGLSSDILKAGHHGSKFSTSEEFLKAVSPRLAVISCGRKNLYGHPHNETLTRLEKAGCSWLSTSDSGAITVVVQDGRWEVYRYVSKTLPGRDGG